MKYPFVFMVWDEDDDWCKGKPEYYVIIAMFDYISAKENMGCFNKKQWWKADIDWREVFYKFDTEKEAMKFIQDWWSKRDLDKIYSGLDRASK